MKKLVVLLLVSLMATTAFAGIDPDPDMLGVYFDTDANMNCTTATPNVPFPAYITITNPTSAEVHGLECGYEVVVPAGMDGLFFRLGNSLPAGAVDLGNSDDKLIGDYVVGLASPLPGNGAVQFVSWNLMLLGAFPVDIFLGPSTIQSIDDGLPAYEIGGAIRSLGLATGGVGTPVASINGDCPVAVEEASFGSVKSLFR